MTEHSNVHGHIKKKKEKETCAACGMYGGRKIHTGIWWRDLMEIAHLEDVGVDGRIILNWIFKKWNGEAWTGLLWLRRGTDVGHL
jgi:hypothetical protein